MKVTIHVAHNDPEELQGAHAAAISLGFAVTARGDFMGKHHTEFSRELSPDAIAAMLETLGTSIALAA